MAQKVYPEWVQKHKKRGTAIKKVGNNYYLYKHSSKRVPGKKNPVPVDTYIGRITPDGVLESEVKKIDVKSSNVIVKEFGFSYAVEKLCTQQWKEILGSSWQEVLDYIIFKESPESYIAHVRKIPEHLDPLIQYASQKGSLKRRIENMYNIQWEELKSLSTIYLVMISNRKYVSVASEEQQVILDRLSLSLEVF